MNDADLGPKPDPVVEEKEPNPGGADALPDDSDDEGLARDPDPSANPAVDEIMPPEITAPDTEKTQSPDGDAADAETGEETDPEAGQGGRGRVGRAAGLTLLPAECGLGVTG
ncbi:hypothetical protein [Nocardioides sp. B-3]|uniref:hypothetical protein n=1 Tax=Nocardioides sp. B-3 TaxID=2895565 RepID=UPI002152C14A|nr:hypothetical protein [Nocardioides sp. B-3]UUZ60600.1 hypothetical protein LP418_07025 [Nocardioides sp. B-3]